MEQERLLGRSGAAHPGQGVVPEQRGPAEASGLAGAAYAAVPYRGGEVTQSGGPSPGTRLRVDARRNLESVLRAAREVFGEFGYGAPMEEVARRAGVGVGTVYRRFPSKEVLVQRIAAEEVAWLTAQARDSLYGGAGAWEALAGYLARAVSTGAGRLLPPEAFRYAEELGRVPEQRSPDPAGAGGAFGSARYEPRATGLPGAAYGSAPGPLGGPVPGQVPGQPSGQVPGQLPGEAAGGPVRAGAGAGTGAGPTAEGETAALVADADPRLLLQLLAALVARAGAAGELRPGVTVADVVLVLTASVPVHAWRGGPPVGPVVAGTAGAASGSEPAGSAEAPQPTGGPQADGRSAEGPSDRLLQILLDGLRAR
ncbi:helix-turn-helix domain-containing protein [Kitasatospora purpeofusca]|uniref:TetR/AcrR family transcriptional regulator n=1 Tax=Kitasatospora purpeofusca TaxID=67352 RepID=UPI002A5AEA02|nr:helix-turn-helix domain-containing protein [Kitasatospora purpeofusca]MDY0814457.1 helix-turn-helix domain-containing protein [Kitasatospora purpeofusca]